MSVDFLERSFTVFGHLFAIIPSTSGDTRNDRLYSLKRFSAMVRVQWPLACTQVEGDCLGRACITSYNINSWFKSEVVFRPPSNPPPPISTRQNTGMGNAMYCQCPKRRITGIMVIVSTCKRCQVDPPCAGGVGPGWALDCKWPLAEFPDCD